MKKAVVLLSGGLDSATVLAIAKAQGFDCYCLSLDYHQRHVAELQAADRVSKALNAAMHRTVNLDLSMFGGSALTDNSIAVPQSPTEGIPVTYVPARNTIMLSLALAWAETLVAQDIFIGVNALDYSGYPDCRQEYVEAFQRMANLATKSAIEGKTITIHAPLIDMTKAQIIQAGHAIRQIVMARLAACVIPAVFANKALLKLDYPIRRIIRDKSFETEFCK